MNITRRSLFKRAAAVLAVAPFLSLPSVAEATPKIATSELGGAVQGSMGRGELRPSLVNTVPVYPKFSIVPVNQPTKEDPLGQFGFVAMKYTVDGKQYGNYVKVSDVFHTESTISHAKEILLQHEKVKLRLINPQAYFVV
jgi:hypothetical protein